MPSNLYPTSVQISQASIDKLTRILKNAYKDVTKQITTATDFGVNNRRVILSQIEVRLEQAGVDVAEFIAEELPSHYAVGAEYATKQLRNVGADLPISGSFSVVNKNAVQFLVDETTQQMFESLTGVKRSANLLLGRATRETITQQIATGQISGANLKQVAKTIKGTLVEQGLDALVDKSGRGWSLDTYSEMLFRTKVVQARNYGFANELVQNGYDLVQVSGHGATDVCGKWEGKILSLTGNTPGYPTLAEAEVSGLFHPNCKHAINAMTPSLANKTKAYDSTQKTVKLPDQPKKSKLASVIIGDSKFSVSEGEKRLIEKRGLKFSVDKSRKNYVGAYFPNSGEIKMKKKTLESESAKRTFYHELGHFIDFEKNMGEVGRESGQRPGSKLSLQKEFRNAYNEERKNIVARRIKDGMTTGNFVKDSDIEDYITGGIVDLFDSKTKEKIGQTKLSTKYRRYVNSSIEVFGDGYGQYRTQPDLLKKESPKMFAYFDDLHKNKL